VKAGKQESGIMGTGMVEIFKQSKKNEITVKMSLTQSNGLTSRGTLVQRPRGLFFL
jgi:hypothetical protein